MYSKIFTEFDEFCAANPQVDGEWLMNGGGVFKWQAESLELGNSSMLRGITQTGLITEGIESSGFYQFYVPLVGAWRNNGVGFKDDGVMVIEPGAEYCVTTNVSEGFHGFFVPMQNIPQELKTGHELAALSYTLHNQKQLTNRVRNLFNRIITAITENPSIEFSPAIKMMEAELLSLFLPLLVFDQDDERHHRAKGRKAISKMEIMQRTRKVLEAFNNDPIHVSQLASLVGVSERTLRTVFNELYQLGPSQYLRIRELHKTRHDLLLSNPEEKTVTDILTHWGIWELGRFAGRYKLHFGELPHETLRRQSPVSDLS